MFGLTGWFTLKFGILRIVSSFVSRRNNPHMITAYLRRVKSSSIWVPSMFVIIESSCISCCSALTLLVANRLNGRNSPLVPYMFLSPYLNPSANPWIGPAIVRDAILTTILSIYTIDITNGSVMYCGDNPSIAAIPTYNILVLHERTRSPCSSRFINV